MILAYLSGLVAKDTDKDKIHNPKPSAPGDIGTSVDKIMNWGAWVVMAVCGFAVLAAAARMAMAHKSGADGGQHLMGLVWIAVAAILVGSGAAVINTLV